MCQSKARRGSRRAGGVPSLREDVEAVADAGDIPQLVHCLTRTWYTRVLQPAEKVDLIERAIQTHAKAGLMDLVDALLIAIVSHDAELLIRAQVHAGEKLAGIDAAARKGLPDIPPGIALEDLRRIQDQEAHLCSVLHDFARIRRLLAMVDDQQEEIEKAPNKVGRGRDVVPLFTQDADHA